MNRFIAIAPLALLSTACGPARTPATALDLSVVPMRRDLVLPSDGEALASWQLPPSIPWARYEKLTLLTYLAETPVLADMPDVNGMLAVHRARAAAERLAAIGVPQGTLWIVDLRGAASVAFGATLSRLSATKIAPVMTFNNWPAENEVVPAEQTLAALVTMRPKPLSAADTAAVPVFMLDAWRLAMRDQEPDDEAIDNRYMLLPSDFPDAATLQAAGIKRVVYVVEDRGSAATEEDDVHEVALAYEGAGIGMAIVDLATLSTLGGEERWAEAPTWDVWLSDWSYTVQIRTTILDDPTFYARARGGFGGIRAAPGGGRSYDPATPSIGGHSHHGGSGRVYSGASPHVSGGSGG
jgi:hypothetical protein